MKYYLFMVAISAAILISADGCASYLCGKSLLFGDITELQCPANVDHTLSHGPTCWHASVTPVVAKGW